LVKDVFRSRSIFHRKVCLSSQKEINCYSYNLIITFTTSFILLLLIFNSCSSEKNVSISNKSILTPQPSVEVPQGNSPIEVNRLKWKQNKLNTYQFQFQWQCFCAHDYVVPVLVTANQGVITEIVNAKSGQSVSVNRYKNYLTMGGLFDFVQSAIDENAIQIDVNYHPKYGFPTRV